MKRIIKNAILIGICSTSMLHASFEFRSPLSVEYRGMMHWPLVPAQRAWWIDAMPNDKKDSKWCVHTWSTGYTRNGHEAFFNTEENKNTRKTVPLSTLFFGKSAFRGEEAFTGGTFAGASIADRQLLERNNAFLGFSRFTPVFDYNEYGAYWGVDFSRTLGEEDKWHVGGRVSLPFKVIEIEHDSACKFEETLDDVIRIRPINIDAGAGANQEEYAIRFDFLNSLLFNSAGMVVPVVQYAQLPANPNMVRIFATTLSGDAAGAASVNAYVIKRDDSEFPLPLFRKQATQVSGALGIDGSGPDNATLFFSTAIPYQNNLATNRDAQSRLFVVPRALDNNANAITPNAAAILTTLGPILREFALTSPASEFLRTRGIDLCTHERITAVGDLDFEVYGGYGTRTNWFVDGMFGIRAPSGKRQKDPSRVYFQSTGHNGHAEIKLAVEGGWMPREWFAFKLDGSFHHAFKRTQKVAAPFRGATIRGIGPAVDAKISWNYFTLHVDFNFFHPRNPELGCMFGYELFAKRKDKVDLAQTTATDLFNRTNQALDATLLETRTNTMSHKIRGQIFHRFNYFELFAGSSHIIAGRSAMKETEGHIGFAVYF